MKTLSTLIALCLIVACLSTLSAQGGPGSGPGSDTSDFCPSVGALPGTHPLLPGSNHRCEDHSGDNHANDQMAMIDLAYADLSGCDFTDTVMPNVTLSNAWLIGANLTHIDLSSADLCFADLTAADLTTARLANADLSFAGLTGAIGLSTVIGTPSYNCHTDFSGTGFDPVAAGWNLVPCDAFTVDRAELSLSAGGAQRLFLNGSPAVANHFHLILGSTSGTNPGTPASGFVIPLNYPDFYFSYTLSTPNSVYLPQSLGTLDGEADASAAFIVPAGSPAGLDGLVLHHAFVAFLSSGVTFASNAVSLTLVP